MKLDDLSKLLQTLSGKKDNKQWTRAIAHWLKKVKDAKNGKYTSYDEHELPSLIKIAEMKLLAMEPGDKKERIGTMHIRLTPDGEELYKELFQTGYFLKS